MDWLAAAILADRSRSGDGELAYMTDIMACRASPTGLHMRMGHVDARIIEKFCGLLGLGGDNRR
jgi:hypothetical protein